jgi:hypothetical protein
VEKTPSQPSGNKRLADAKSASLALPPYPGQFGVQDALNMASVAKLGLVPPQPAPFRPDDILTPDQLAGRLQVPLSWVYKHTDKSRSSRNRLPVLKCDGFLRFSWTDVCAWLRSNKV